MAADDRAKTIFQLLTSDNCRVVHEPPPDKKNTKGRGWYGPTQLKEWEEFNFSTLESIYDGKLMEEARKSRNTLPHYPTLSLTDDRVTDERTTVSVLTKWNHTIVNAALEAVQDPLHPSLWVHWKGISNWHDFASSLDKGQKTREGVPDGGAIAACESGPASVDTAKERLPKEYKPALKWHSRSLHRLVNEDGRWIGINNIHNDAMPLRQAFTYCVEKGCRYGCIVSTQEAFIFRIRPIKKIRGKM